MQSKRKRILAMLENGIITTDEALTLLENLSNETEEVKKPEVTVELEKPAQPAQPEQQKQSEQPKQPEQDFTEQKETSDKEFDEKKSSNQEKQSTDEFLEDIRKDFAHVGDRFMQFMQTAVQKVKDFDFDSPFGQSVQFTHSVTKPANGLEEIIVDVDNGKVNIHRTEEQEVRAEFSVKAYNGESEEAAKEKFLEKLLFVVDEETLRLSSPLKMSQVNIDLYIPHATYRKLSARLMNGSFNMKDVMMETIRVKTSNGKIEVAGVTFNNAEFETANGAIELKELTGEKLEAETLNGRVYIDGALQEIEAQSFNGHVVVTATNNSATKIDAKSMSGSVEIYVPATTPLSGTITTNIGKLNLQLEDVNQTSEQEQILQRTIRFTKEMEDEDNQPLYIFGEAKTGSVLVSYNGISE